MNVPVPAEAEGEALKEERKLSVGAYLSRERERRKIPLAEVSKVTRISLQYLEALEKDQFQALPASIFVRSFLRTYAAFLGLDPKETMKIYESQMDLLRGSEEKEPPPPPKKMEPLIKYILTLFIIALGVGIAYIFFSEQTPPPPSPAPEIRQPQATPGKPPSSEALASPEKAPLQIPEPGKSIRVQEKPPAPSSAMIEGVKKKERRHVLKVKATEKAWLRIQSDDQPELEALLQPNQTATWTAQYQFKVTIGNAGGVDLSLNGIPQGRLGDSGKVVHLLLPKEVKPQTEEKEQQ